MSEGNVEFVPLGDDGLPAQDDKHAVSLRDVMASHKAVRPRANNDDLKDQIGREKVRNATVKHIADFMLETFNSNAAFGENAIASCQVTMRGGKLYVYATFPDRTAVSNDYTLGGQLISSYHSQPVAAFPDSLRWWLDPNRKRTRDTDE